MKANECAIDGSCCGPTSICCSQWEGGIHDPKFRIRRATKSDLEPVSEMLTDSHLPVDGVADFIGNFLVAEYDGAIVGSIGLEHYGPAALLRSAAVAKSMQGKGIGRRLVNEILGEAEKSGVTDVYLLTTTAENYFPSFGFERIERASVPDALGASAELQGACPASAVVMRKEIIIGR